MILQSWEPTIDWGGLPGCHITLADADLEVALTPAWSENRGEVAVRDPLDSNGQRATTSVPVGT